mmetsp:Transcript_22042/g.65770  ORF Transcript_22042/g.65770 Transcript_22042/m.65770 type:complete len:281 (-) Transcript_22042:165-1007(-)
MDVLDDLSHLAVHRDGGQVMQLHPCARRQLLASGGQILVERGHEVLVAPTLVLRALAAKRHRLIRCVGRWLQRVAQLRRVRAQMSSLALRLAVVMLQNFAAVRCLPRAIHVELPAAVRLLQGLVHVRRHRPVNSERAPQVQGLVDAAPQGVGSLRVRQPGHDLREVWDGLLDRRHDGRAKPRVRSEPGASHGVLQKLHLQVRNVGFDGNRDPAVDPHACVLRHEVTVLRRVLPRHEHVNAHLRSVRLIVPGASLSLLGGQGVCLRSDETLELVWEIHLRT